MNTKREDCSLPIPKNGLPKFGHLCDAVALSSTGKHDNVNINKECHRPTRASSSPALNGGLDGLPL